MMLLNDLSLCCGCGACSAVCPKQCIAMRPDPEGFLYPVINHEVCVSCGKCNQVCPVLNQPQLSENTYAYAANNNNTDIRMKSSSGGVFSLLAEYVLHRKGKVYGAVYDSGFAVIHQKADSVEQLPPFHGAKYSQSYAYACFPQIRKELDDGEYVLFVGTPCQTAALKKYLNRDYETLILTDMICHGVPSPLVWKKYLNERLEEDAPGSSIQSVNLRSKISGWSRYGYSVEIRYTDGKHYCVKQGNDLFMQGFVRNLYLRPSCSKCSFKGFQRCSDFTLGDCWGIWDIHPEIDDDSGTSLLLVHTEKARKIWNLLAEQCTIFELTEEQAIAQNPSAVSSSVPHPKREVFFRNVKEQDKVTGIIKSCLYPDKKNGIKRLLARIIRK